MTTLRSQIQRMLQIVVAKVCVSAVNAAGVKGAQVKELPTTPRLDQELRTGATATMVVIAVAEMTETIVMTEQSKRSKQSQSKGSLPVGTRGAWI